MKTKYASLHASRTFVTLILPLLAGCDKAPTARMENDFPTQARVEYVLQCMEEHGGQNYDNMYHCVCMVDKVAEAMSYDDFAQAQTFTYLFNTPGERGGEFRDPPQSAKLRTQLKEVTTQARETCFPNAVEQPTTKR